MSDVGLRPLAPGDAERMLRWMLDPEVAENVGVRRAPTPEYTAEWIARATDDPSIEALAIVLDARHVGNVVLDRIDRESRIARLSIYVGEAACRGSGVGQRALRAALGEAFGRLRLRKVYLTVHERNVGAIRAYERAGFVLEGRLRQEFLLRGEWIDSLYYGALAGERADARTGADGT